MLNHIVKVLFILLMTVLLVHIEKAFNPDPALRVVLGFCWGALILTGLREINGHER